MIQFQKISLYIFPFDAQAVGNHSLSLHVLFIPEQVHDRQQKRFWDIFFRLLFGLFQDTAAELVVTRIGHYIAAREKIADQEGPGLVDVLVDPALYLISVFGTLLRRSCQTVLYAKKFFLRNLAG